MKKKQTIINPNFIKAMHENTTMDSHAVVIMKIELRRTKKGYKEKVIMHSFPECLYEAYIDFGVEIP
jgi:hypothetical protein